MLHKIDKYRLDKVLQVVKSVDIKFINKKIGEVTGFSKGHVSNILNGNVAMTEKFYETFLKHFDTNSTMINKPDKPLHTEEVVQNDGQQEKSLHALIESNKMLVETNKDLTAMLKQSYYNKASSDSQLNIVETLKPWIQIIASGGVDKLWKDERAGQLELSKILNEYLNQKQGARRA